MTVAGAIGNFGILKPNRRQQPPPLKEPPVYREVKMLTPKPLFD